MYVVESSGPCTGWCDTRVSFVNTSGKGFLGDPLTNLLNSNFDHRMWSDIEVECTYWG